MAKLDEEKLKEQIKAQSFSNAYFIYGEESYLKEYYVGVLKEKLVDKAFEDFKSFELNDRRVPSTVKL